MKSFTRQEAETQKTKKYSYPLLVNWQNGQIALELSYWPDVTLRRQQIFENSQLTQKYLDSVNCLILIRIFEFHPCSLEAHLDSLTMKVQNLITQMDIQLSPYCQLSVFTTWRNQVIRLNCIYTIFPMRDLSVQDIVSLNFSLAFSCYYMSDFTLSTTGLICQDAYHSFLVNSHQILYINNSMHFLIKYIILRKTLLFDCMQSIAQLIINKSLTGRIYDLQLMYCILLVLSLARVLSALEGNTAINDLEPPSSQTKFAFKDLIIEFFWDFDDVNKEVIMMLAYDWPAFFGFGFGKSMSHADLWVFEVEGQLIKATDHIALKQGYPPTDVSQGGTDDLKVLGFQYDGLSKTKVKFKRKQVTGDPNDFDLLPNPMASVIFAYGPTKDDYDLTYHKDKRGSFEFRFEQGSNEDAKSQYDWKQVHQWTNIVCWGILVDVAILIPRLFRTSSWRMGVHGLLMAAITAATLVVNALIFKQHLDVFEDGNFGKKDLKSKLHIILGLLGALLIVAQCLGGFFVHWLIKSNVVNEAISKKPVPHAILGHVIYVLMKVQIVLGLYKVQEYMMQLWIAYSVIFLWRAVVELLYQR